MVTFELTDRQLEAQGAADARVVNERVREKLGS